MRQLAGGIWSGGVVAVGERSKFPLQDLMGEIWEIAREKKGPVWWDRGEERKEGSKWGEEGLKWKRRKEERETREEWGQQDGTDGIEGGKGKGRDETKHRRNRFSLPQPTTKKGGGK